MTVPTPTVSAMVGTFERSPSKNRALAMIVSCASVFTLVLETRLEPGSLKAMWPSGPIPDKTKGAILNITAASTKTVKGIDAKVALRTNLKCVAAYSTFTAQWPPDLQQRARSLRQPLSCPQRLDTQLASPQHCRLRYECSLLLCLCAWRSYSTWRSGSFQGDLWEALCGYFMTLHYP